MATAATANEQQQYNGPYTPSKYIRHDLRNGATIYMHKHAYIQHELNVHTDGTALKN